MFFPWRNRPLSLCFFLLLPQAQAAYWHDVREALPAPTINKRQAPEPLTLRPLHRLDNGLVRHQQHHRGVPVYNSRVLTQADGTAVHGELLLGLDDELDTSPVLTTEDVYRIAEEQSGLGVFADTRHQGADLHIIFENGSDRARLVYRVSFVAPGPYVARPICIIDAHSGEVLDSWDGLSGYVEVQATGVGGNPNTGRYTFGEGKWSEHSLQVQGPDKGRCRMNNTWVETYDLNDDANRYSFNRFADSYTFPCQVPYHSDGQLIEGAYAPINDAHFFATQAAQKLGLSGLKVGINIDDRPPYRLAWWDGTGITLSNGLLVPSYALPQLDCPNGYCQLAYPPAVVDIVGHEVAHAYIERRQGPENRKNSDAAALNEAFADIVGLWLRQQLQPTEPLSWSVGPEVLTDRVNGGGLRDFRRSRCDQVNCLDPASGLDKYTRGDVIRQAFYTLVSRGGLSLEEAFAVYRRALETYWRPLLSFQDAAKGVYCAADARQKSQVVTSFELVGIRMGEVTDSDCLLTKQSFSVQEPPGGFQFNETCGVFSCQGLESLSLNEETGQGAGLSSGGQAGIAAAVITVVTGVSVAALLGVMYYFRQSLNQKWHRLRHSLPSRV